MKFLNWLHDRQLDLSSVFWLLLGCAGSITDNDAVFVLGLVSSTVNSVGAYVISKINAKENN